MSSNGVVAVFDPAIARFSSSLEKRRPLTATIFMPFDTPAAKAGSPGHALSTRPSVVTWMPSEPNALRPPSSDQGSVNMLGASVKTYLYPPPSTPPRGTFEGGGYKYVFTE